MKVTGCHFVPVTMYCVSWRCMHFRLSILSILVLIRYRSVRYRRRRRERDSCKHCGRETEMHPNSGFSSFSFITASVTER